jgi:hypothetical protein
VEVLTRETQAQRAHVAASIRETEHLAKKVEELEK